MKPRAIALLMTCLAASGMASGARGNIVVRDSHVVIDGLANGMNSVGVRDPEGRFFVVNDSEVKCAGIKMLKDGAVDIEVADVLGVSWDSNGQPHIKRVFRRPGRYRILISDNLETEDDNSNSVS